MKIKTLASVAIVAALAATPFATKASDSATSSASAVVAAAVAIANDTPLEFGNFAPTGTAGTLVIATNSGVTSTNVDVLSGTTPTAAAFTVTGEEGVTVNITVPTSVTLNGPSSATMVATLSDNGVTTIGTGGSSQLLVGASLAVGATQTAGSYSGTFNVTAAYN